MPDIHEDRNSIRKQNIAGDGAMRRNTGTRKKVLLIGGCTVALIGIIYFGWEYWTVGRFEVTTDDAYVQADNTTVAPRVSGYLDVLFVTDNEHVQKGQVLAHIDDRDFKTAVQRAQADLSAAQALVEAKQASLTTQQSIIAGAKATIGVDEANETFLIQDEKRYAGMAKNGAGSLQASQQASSRYVAMRATIVRDNATLATVADQVDTLKAELAQAQANVGQAAAAAHQAKLNLSYTTITSAIDGVVGERTLRVGQYVDAGTPLMAVVPLQATYIIANFKETQLTNVKPGQRVDVEVDMFPSNVVHGIVDSLAPGSGEEFALLPPDNATGNFTKIVQRIPVKIRLDPRQSLAGELRPGMSVEPTILTNLKSWHSGR